MNKVINIRSTSGGGKTTLARQFLKTYGATALKNHKGRTFANHIDTKRTGLAKDIFLLGSYDNVCGGCDGIKTQDLICSLIRELSKGGHVLYEGLIVSGLFSRYRALAEELSARTHFIFGYLDTPLEVCITRTQQRRIDAGNLKPFDPLKTLAPKYHSVQSTRTKFLTAGHDVRDIPQDNGFAEVSSWLS